jgi:hypothetical protein
MWSRPMHSYPPDRQRGAASPAAHIPTAGIASLPLLRLTWRSAAFGESLTIVHLSNRDKPMPVYKLTPKQERLDDPRWQERTRLRERCWVEAATERAARIYVGSASILVGKRPPTFRPEPSP